MPAALSLATEPFTRDEPLDCVAPARLKPCARREHVALGWLAASGTGARELSAAIRRAADVEAVAAAARRVRRLARATLARGMSPGMITRVVSALNDCITERVIELELARAPLPEADFCWIALGSEGRLEQTLCTDQDNGIVFEARSGRGDDEVRAALVPIAGRINAALTACGFPACSGGVMAGNPECCLSAGEWRRQFQDWMEQPDPRALLNASIFFDLRPVHGHRALALGLQAWLATAAPRHPRFLALMAENALERTPPLGLFGGLVVASEGDGAGTLDLKLQGITPFVDAARVLALAHGCGGPSTERRLREVGERLGVSGPEVEAWLDAFRFVQVLRLERQDRLGRARQPLHNRVDPRELNPLQRRFLVESLRQARNLQKLLAGRQVAASVSL